MSEQSRDSNSSPTLATNARVSIDTWLKRSAFQLHENGSDSPRADVELLAQNVLGCDRTWLRTWGDKPLSDLQHSQLDKLLKRRLDGEPVAYILGERGFWSLMLDVSPATLIPRPDTETLVEWALELDLSETTRCLDLGTGTGAIALALASERSDWDVTGVDFSQDAVELARGNALKNRLEQVAFIQSDWFGRVSGKFHLIVSNPPYIDPEDEHLALGDVRFEPRSALVAEDQGLADIEHIVANSRTYLEVDGWLLLEHGYQQAGAVQACLEQAGFEQVSIRYDFGGQPRITGGCWQPEMSERLVR